MSGILYFNNCIQLNGTINIIIIIIYVIVINTDGGIVIILRVILQRSGLFAVQKFKGC